MGRFLLHVIFPSRQREREAVAEAMRRNAMATDSLTSEIRSVAQCPDKTQRMVRVNGHRK